MWYSNGDQFSTKDRDNNDYSSRNCAVYQRSGWWHENCTWTNLNGQYYESKQHNNDAAIYWYNWRYSKSSMKRVDMKIKPN